MIAAPNAESRQEAGDRGTQLFGANHTVIVRSAGSFSASPSANPGGRRKRVGRAGTCPLRTIAIACRSCPGRAAQRRHRQLRQTTAGAAAAPPAPSDRRAAGAAYGERPADPDARVRRRRDTAKLLPDGMAAAPADAPAEVQQAIWAANEIIGKPYVYGGGHAASRTAATTARAPSPTRCIGGGLLDGSPLDSVSFMSWGERGRGRLDHRLHEPRPRLRRDRRAAPRHERRGRSVRRQGPALAPGPALHQGFIARHPDGF